MSYVTNTYGTNRPNFLESEIGLVTKTYQIPTSMGVADGARRIVPAGTPYPANDATAVGLTFTDADVTDGDRVGSVMVAGRVLTDRVTVASAAQTAMKDIRFVGAPEVKRGLSVTYTAGDGTGTPPVDGSSYQKGDTVAVSVSYPLTKEGNTQTGWSLTSGGAAVSSFRIEADATLYPVWTVSV